VIAGDRAYVGSSTGAVFAVDVHTGAELWRGSTGGAGTGYSGTGYQGWRPAKACCSCPPPPG
jgi:outer membrane protein assembly factor BamB